ncbi:hypothetical protein QQF64_003968 [Cirrhinus molitorella]|uniref:Uncharacterized protein n=1 Tax=Cirrhinus molitorella TaxID=172907 RepID=A0ABR3MMV2_9TELE
MCMEQRRCSINPLELQEKLCEEGIDIEQKGSDSLIFGKNEREKRRITKVMFTDGVKTAAERGNERKGEREEMLVVGSEGGEESERRRGAQHNSCSASQVGRRREYKR